MKILLVITNKFGTGGITSSVLNYYNNMDRCKCHFDFVVQNEMDSNIRESLKSNSSEYFVLGGRKCNPIGYTLRLKKLIKNGDYDIVHVHGNSATMAFEMMAAKMAGCRVRIAHGHNTASRYGFLEKLLRPLFYRTCNVRFACGRDVGKWLFGGRDFHIVKNGCDTQEFIFNAPTRRRVRKENSLDDLKIIGQVGRLDEVKNQEYSLSILVKLVKNDENFRLVLAGEGPSNSELHSIVAKQNLSKYVIFLGNVKDVNEWYQAFDCLILPSLYEGFPMAMVEAQLAGLKCIVSDCVTRDADITMTSKYLSIGKGFEDEWAKCITRCCEISQEKRKEIAAKASMAGYDIRSLAKELEDMYDKLSKDKSLK